MDENKVYDKNTGFIIGNYALNNVPKEICSSKELQLALETMILSASGWRKVFASGGDPESRNENISEPDRILALAAAEVYSQYVISLSNKKDPTVVVGLDSRFTGPLLADLMIRVLIKNGIKVHYLFISAAPETMAYVKCSDFADGFIYISASHNPVGYNGFKFGSSDGSVLGGKEAKTLIDNFIKLVNEEKAISKILIEASRVLPKTLFDIFSSVEGYKQTAVKIYKDFLWKTALSIGSDNGISYDLMKSKISEISPGIVADMNGSARACSVDKDLLTELGINFFSINGKPRDIVHTIVPEGDSLIPCKKALEKKVWERSSYIMGYLPDNDGDRGNIVLWDSHKISSVIPSAQDVFALVVLSELLFVDFLNHDKKPVAVVVNGPTSLRIEEIADYFNAEVFYSEVGEANVVSLSAKLRNEGYLVRILGEGSNGGNITFPATVRDPMNTILSLLKLLYYRSDELPDGLFSRFLKKKGVEKKKYRNNYSLSNILSELPSYMTTGAYEERALMKVSIPHGELKRRYENIFLDKWSSDRDFLEKEFGIYDYEQINYEGIEARYGWGSDFRTGEEKGGFKIQFRNKDGKKIGFIWMRGSGTEPVFRVMADLRCDDPKKEAKLLSWHKSIIDTALNS